MLFWKEFKKTAASLLYVVYILAVIAAYVTQFAPELEEPVAKPVPGLEDYGTIAKEVPEVLMKEASAGLREEFLRESYDAYPMGFYREVHLTEEKTKQMKEVLNELSTDPLTYERFRELMRRADQLIGGGSRYCDAYLVRYFSNVPKTYEDALEEYELFLHKDKVMGGYARLFCDYMGVLVASILPAFLGAALGVKDRRAKMEEVVYGKAVASFHLIFTRFFAALAAAALPVVLLAAAATIQVGKLYPDDILDRTAFFRYAGFWLMPQMMVSMAVGMLFSHLADRPVGILVQGIWWLFAMCGKTGVLTGSIGRFDLIPRHNSLLKAGEFLDRIGNLAFNRTFYTLLSLGLVFLTTGIYEQKRRGKAFGTKRFKNHMPHKSEI